MFNRGTFFIVGTQNLIMTFGDSWVNHVTFYLVANAVNTSIVSWHVSRFVGWVDFQETCVMEAFFTLYLFISQGHEHPK